MNFNKLAFRAALILVALSAWLTLAREHDFAKHGTTDPAPMDQATDRKFQTATFALG